MRYVVFLVLVLFTNLLAAKSPQGILLGPITGHQTDSSAILWILVTDQPDSIKHLVPNQKIKNFDQLDAYLFNYSMEQNFDAIFYNKKDLNYINHISTLKITLSKGSYEFFGEEEDGTYKVTTQKDYSFLVGSGLFDNQDASEEDQKPFAILDAMSKKYPDFMIWLGDNINYQDKRLDSYEKLFMDQVKLRTNPTVAEFMTSCPQFAIWDDLDHQNTDAATTSALGKDQELDLFKQFWPNSNFGTENTKGTFNHFRHEDAEFFMLDNRFHKTPGVTMFGRAQMAWLKKKLSASRANFKFIVSGSPILAESKNGEDLNDFPDEKQELLAFIKQQDISGVIFLNGDRPYSELNFQYRSGTYPLHEFTCSPLSNTTNTATTTKNPLRVKKTLVKKRNFGRITISGKLNERICKLEVFDHTGVMAWSYTLDIIELQ